MARRRETESMEGSDTGDGDPLIVELTSLLQGVERSAEDLFDSLEDDTRVLVTSARGLKSVLRRNPDHFRYSTEGRYRLATDEERLAVPERPRADQDPASSPVSPRLPSPDTHPGRSTGWRTRDEDVLVISDLDGSADASIELERDLRSRLKGHRLVAEIGIDKNIHNSVTSALTHVVKRTSDPMRVAKNYPALLAVYLVGHGVFEYSEGTFWAGMAVPDVDRSYGPAFEKATAALELETFEDLVAGDERAHRYVGPILAHGGVPAHYLSDYFQLLTNGLASASDATDLMTLWRTRRTAFTHIAKPVRRFLLFGSDLAVDFIERTIDLVTENRRSRSIPSAEDVGIPDYVRSAFVDFVTARGPVRLSTRHRGLQPRVMIDPWDAMGPTIELPVVKDGSSDDYWRIHGDRQADRVNTSRVSEGRVRLNPSSSWTVQLSRSGMTETGRTFEGLGVMPALFFDPDSGDMVRAAGGIRLPSVWVLTPADASVTGIATGTGEKIELDVVEHLPQPGGRWSGYTLKEYDLEGIRALSIRESPTATEEHRLAVRALAERPSLIGNPVRGVRTAAGEAVLPAVPALRLPGLGDPEGPIWKVRLLVDGKQVEVDMTARADDSAIPPGTNPDAADRDVLDLPVGVGCHHVSLTARGPLGADLRETFVVIPGLDVVIPDRLLFPGDNGTVTISAPDLMIDGKPAGVDQHYPIPDDASSVAFSIESVDTDVIDRLFDLTAQCPRVMWAVTGDSDSSFDFTTRPETLTTDEVRSGTRQLVARTGRNSEHLRLTLDAPGESLQETAKVAPGGADGRWLFPLDQFGDTIRSTTATELELVLWIGNRPVTVARIRPVLDVTGLEATVAMDGGAHTVHCSCDPLRPMKHRVARLWSITRPWDDPVTTPLDEDTISSFAIRLDATTPIGEYLLEVAIEDGWNRIERPDRNAPGTTIVSVGTGRDIRVRTLQPAHMPPDPEHPRDPLDVLEGLLSLGRFHRPLSDNETRSVMPAATLSAVLMLRGQLTPAWQSGEFTLLRGLLLADQPRFLETLLDGHERRIFGRADLQRVAITIGHKVSPQEGLDDSLARRAWDLIPALALAMDLTEQPDPDQQERIASHTGWSPGESPDVSLTVGQAIEQRYLGMDADTLAMIRQRIDLVPRNALDLDTYVAANFEWLAADKETPETAVRWWRNSCRIPGDVENDFPAARTFLDARVPPRGTEKWAALPHTVLGLCIRLMSGGPDTTQVSQALLDAAAFAPRLVEHDLVLAQVLAHADADGASAGTTNDQDPDATTTDDHDPGASATDRRDDGEVSK